MMKISGEKKGSSNCYKNGQEHLSDELTKLEILIHLQVLRFRDIYSPQKATNDDGLSGLCIKDEDVDRVLEKKPGIRDDDRLREAIDQLESVRKQISMKTENSLKQEIYLPFRHLSHLFHLTLFEMDIILVCLASELDLKYEKLYAYLQDDVTKKSPSVNLVLELLCINREEKANARACFFNHSPLLKHRLVQFIDGDEYQHIPLLSRRLKLDDRIVNFLLGFDVMDSGLNSWAKMLIPQKDWTDILIEENIKEGFLHLSGELLNERESDKKRIIIYLKGAYGTGKKSVAEAFCHELQLPLIFIDSRELLNIDLDFEEVLQCLFREALLQSAALYLEHGDCLISDNDNPKKFHYQNQVTRLVEEYSFITFLAGESDMKPLPGLMKHFFIEVPLGIPTFPMRKQLWQINLNGNYSLATGIDIDGIATKFRFTGGQIRDSLHSAHNLAKMRWEKNTKITGEDLTRACRANSNHKLSELARKIRPIYSWSDIVLPDDKLKLLKEIRNHVKYRQVVYDEWQFGSKFSLGKGLNILFSGPSGTGKTMSAEIIARDLGLDLYKIDLSSVVSKYIGETEKNLSKIFKEAETSNCILFFDEADALFGKRTEVKDAHDRYANIEVNYLLQKMEEYEGTIILATNLSRNIDDAFIRRIHFLVDFPFPDEIYRFNIWQKIFPGAAPLGTDIDYQFLAQQFKLSGGNIKNIAVSASFLAADDSRKVNMEHIIWGVKREFQKMGKTCSEGDFGEYFSIVRDR